MGHPVVVEKYKKLLKKHLDKNHPSDPPPPKVAKKFKCEGCEKEEPSNWHYVRHISTCIHYKALQPRICGVITNKSMMKGAHQHNISEATACSIMRSLVCGRKIQLYSLRKTSVGGSVKVEIPCLVGMMPTS